MSRWFVFLLVVSTSIFQGQGSKLGSLKKFAISSLTALSLTAQLPIEAMAAEPKNVVTVLGGTGFVGSRVVRDLVGKGQSVVSISQSGAQPAWAQGEEWANSVKWVKGDLRTDNLASYFKDSDAVVSCVGVIGFKDDPSLEVGNGQVNKAAAEQAKKAGVSHFVYIGVSSQVPPLAGELLPNYFAGKAEAETAVRENFPKGGVVVKPTFIYGGEVFTIDPPRVAGFYGRFIEGALSTDFVRLLADKAGAGAVRLTLSPPVDVDRIAEAITASVLDPEAQDYIVLEGTDVINAVAAKY